MDSVRLAIDADKPLPVGGAIKNDKLDRLDFARSVVKSLESIDSLNGFAVSVEGAWGSGKTSTLAMVEELLNQDGKKAIVVHFNPWLVGDRDALLRQFLDTVATTVSETSLVTIGGKIAKAFKNYNALFDAAKYIPGLEPWITITQSIASSVGKVAESRHGNLEYQKKEVEKVLRELEIPIIVFIDDIDRLFPQEVYEMIRIIKAVGDLPNVGYVLAWDAKYIQDALESASVPMAGTYLDKIVQIRLSLPRLSFSVKSALFDEALARLPKEARYTYFPNNQGRMERLFYYGLADMLEQPRDVVRLFNTVMLIEPVLRGEIELADIVGFAALMLKAPAVFDLLRRKPEWFSGRRMTGLSLEKAEDIIGEGKKYREKACDACDRPDAVRSLVNFLFPMVGKVGRAEDVEGHIGAPSRLYIALHMHIGTNDVSLIVARRYLLSPEERTTIEAGLTVGNCQDFLEKLGKIPGTIAKRSLIDLHETCLSVSRLVDQEPFVSKGKAEGVWVSRPLMAADMAIEKIIAAVDADRFEEMANDIVNDKESLTVAMGIVIRSHSEPSSIYSRLVLSEKDREQATQQLAQNILDAARESRLLETGDPSMLLWGVARFAPEKCPAIFKAIEEDDPALDSFMLRIMSREFDSSKGVVYAMPHDKSILEKYCPLADLREKATKRLHSPDLRLPAKAAWMALAENGKFYGVDGSVCED